MSKGNGFLFEIANGSTQKKKTVFEMKWKKIYSFIQELILPLFNP